MHTHDLSAWTHSHVFDSGSHAAERGTRAVMWITAAMMVVEIWAGWWFNSMALLADGWHMSSHALALGLSAFAYVAARRYARNLRFAYLHVIADAATSVLAIVALVGGLLLGLTWLDPAMGIIGAILVARWAWGLLRDTSRVLLDREMDHPVTAEIREVVATLDQTKTTRIADLHLWRVGKARFACILSLVTHDPSMTPDRVKAGLREHEELAHVTVEIHQCRRSAWGASTWLARSR